MTVNSSELSRYGQMPQDHPNEPKPLAQGARQTPGPNEPKGCFLGKGPAPQAPRRAAHPSVKVSERWVYLYRAIDQYDQVIDVLVTEKRDLDATRRFFTRALEHGSHPSEVSTDRAPAYPRVIEELIPAACHIVEQYVNNPVEADHGRLKARLRPMRGLKRLRSARVISAGHAFMQNLHRGHYEPGVDID
ncbi:MAG TPA: DDE-type integrase/transposase/recombinase, partial [Actinomycetes bacterium]|nr:DDE-type integrase/transposase/recombinase [Actinomycetes bacterium]